MTKHIMTLGIGIAAIVLSTTLWDVFRHDPDMAERVVHATGRWGRSAVIDTTTRLDRANRMRDPSQETYYTAWLRMLWRVLLEDDPSVEYVVHLLQDANFAGGSYCASHFLQESRIVHVFMRDVGILAEATRIYARSAGTDWLFTLLARFVLSLERTNDPLLNAQWEAVTATLLAGNDDTAWFYDMLRQAIAYERYRQALSQQWWVQYGRYDPSYLAIRNTFRPHEPWVADFDWSQLGGGGMDADLLELNTFLQAYHIGVHHLALNFPRETEDTRPLPSCPIWRLSAVSNPVRQVAIEAMVNHLRALQYHGHDVYRQTVAVLTDPTRVFDPRTQETVALIQRRIEQQGVQACAGAFTVEELGAVIEASGHFWAEWWGINGRFGWEHLGDWDDVPEWLQGGHIAVLPSSGFENLDDIRDYLLLYHTVRWVDDHLNHYTFVEYDGVLYMDIVRYSAGDMCWEAATHVMMEQRGTRAVVESTATLWSWDWDYDAEGVVRVSDEVVRRFTFINGRIDTAVLCPSCRGWSC